MWIDKDGELRFGDDPEAWQKDSDGGARFTLPSNAFDAGYGTQRHDESDNWMPDDDDPPPHEDDDFPIDWDLEDEDDGN